MCSNCGLDFQYTLTDNKELNETSSHFQMPTIIRQTILSDGYGTPVASLLFSAFREADPLWTQNSMQWRFCLPQWMTRDGRSTQYYLECECLGGGSGA